VGGRPSQTLRQPIHAFILIHLSKRRVANPSCVFGSIARIAQVSRADPAFWIWKSHPFHLFSTRRARIWLHVKSGGKIHWPSDFVLHLLRARLV
jgi:hypothetical protein